jgi:hypothetical protein
MNYTIKFVLEILNTYDILNKKYLLDRLPLNQNAFPK